MPDFQSSHILVLGDLMLDRYWVGHTTRISPEAPVPVVKVEEITDRPGGAGNVALNIASLGCQVNLLAMTGCDANATLLKQTLTAANIHCLFQQSSTLPTITKLRVISRHQQLIRLDFETSFQKADDSELQANFAKVIKHAQVVILSDYGKGTLQNISQLIDLARAHKVPVLIDPKGSDFSQYKGATLLTPNFNEFKTVVGAIDCEQDFITKGLNLIKQLQLEALLITRGEQGMTLLRKGHSECHFPARAQEVFDVTGAGDTVIAVLASALAAGQALPQAVALANLAAGIVVGKLGTAAINSTELRQAVQQAHGVEQGAMSAEQLTFVLQEARARGERIILTNGCFDILHAGHVAYLEQAKKLGERLIVAVNDDDSVRQLKGSGRPINPLDRRMAVLAGLQAVDWVVPFGGDTPIALLKRLKPDILVKGGDYSVEQVVGADVVKAQGGQVRVLSHIVGLSTTDLVEQIRE